MDREDASVEIEVMDMVDMKVWWNMAEGNTDASVEEEEQRERVYEEPLDPVEEQQGSVVSRVQEEPNNQGRHPFIETAMRRSWLINHHFPVSGSSNEDDNVVGDGDAVVGMVGGVLDGEIYNSGDEGDYLKPESNEDDNVVGDGDSGVGGEFFNSEDEGDYLNLKPESDRLTTPVTAGTEVYLSDTYVSDSDDSATAGTEVEVFRRPHYGPHLPVGSLFSLQQPESCYHDGSPTPGAEYNMWGTGLPGLPEPENCPPGWILGGPCHRFRADDTSSSSSSSSLHVDMAGDHHNDSSSTISENARLLDVDELHTLREAAAAAQQQQQQQQQQAGRRTRGRRLPEWAQIIRQLDPACQYSRLLSNLKLILEHGKARVSPEVLAQVPTNKECKFCLKNNETDVVWKSHCVKDSSNRTTCPILRIYTCPFCGASGDNAHTRKYCRNAPHDYSAPMECLNTGRNSTGRIRQALGTSSSQPLIISSRPHSTSSSRPHSTSSSRPHSTSSSRHLSTPTARRYPLIPLQTISEQNSSSIVDRANRRLPTLPPPHTSSSSSSTTTAANMPPYENSQSALPFSCYEQVISNHALASQVIPPSARITCMEAMLIGQMDVIPLLAEQCSSGWMSYDDAWHFIQRELSEKTGTAARIASERQQQQQVVQAHQGSRMITNIFAAGNGNAVPEQLSPAQEQATQSSPRSLSGPYFSFPPRK